jgi:hypothetical protein
MGWPRLASDQLPTAPTAGAGLGATFGRVTIYGSWAGSSMVEQLPLKQRVGGSSPPRLTTYFQ